ncbi:MAG TPA: FliH/SctL family protein [Acidisoma sp.]|uniref:FliH/SctL family protein n=1 Tax=Acidisoma sp. TaxID=1872115 RepID=UPI002BD719DA|nr:FliH/SctL family protein [Acidisoma sp.]HTI00219.1 FliH/SctL family protein [Acidisoma sp.]
MSFVLIRKEPEPVTAVGSEEAAAAVAAEAEAAAQRIAECVAERVAALRGAAEAEGRAAGEAETRAAAEAARIGQEKAVRTAISAFSAATAELMAPLARKEHDLAGLITELAFMLARHVVRQEVALRPDSLRALVATLLDEAVRERHSGQSIVVRLNPQDHTVIAPQFDLPQVHLLADGQIERGGTLVELLTSDGDPIDKIEWDAQIGSRLETLRAALLGEDDGPPPALPPPAPRDTAPPA